jgi:hypothetical protein
MVLMRSCALLLIVSLLALAPAGTAWAGPGGHGNLTVFNGQVTALSGPIANPTAFTLQDRIRSVDLRIVPETMFKARSAEAEVEGFVVSDYAVVSARRVRGAWTAYRIAFDVRPMIAGTLVSGTIVKVGRTGRQLQLRLDTGQMQSVTISPRTRFRINGQPTDSPPDLSKGDLVQILMKPTDRGWVATEINLEATGSVSPG